MFVRQSWYVAAWADEIGPGGMLARTLLGDAVMLYRTGEGRAGALEDRCCHRGLPLSHGRVLGDRIECGYHGLVFDARGACVKVPGQDRIPPNARVRHYEVVEQDHLLWIWMGDEGRADPARIPRHPWHDDPAWEWVKDRYPIAANYQLITDNLMDLTHVGYVHGRTIGGTPQAHSQAQTTVKETEQGVRVERWMLDSIPPPTYTAACRFNTERVDRWMEIDFFAPSTVRIHTGAVDAGTGATEGRRDGGFAFLGLNTMTPETESSTHYFWSGANKRQPGGPSGCDRLRASLEVTFGEDKVVVEAQQKSLERQPEPLVMIASDAGMVRARRLVQAMLQAQG
ncbi:aromatic ring-hydroxylating dioxygenase subunit alpha [Ramlibacter sp. AW1]|uniref:Aromatic ring-hydroxylating dioxygenase subunit alpha n=1 Tax=Ramlibacter aurantiacus TaxID=2801330 RepID=A0A936ZQN4_9BURK|nr:aromatic ring-hydroxylating dioxygenase subunit alpha [Ramlibacter aurantiacus]MBL0421936.1 aromatic ring-hydroxylating dioxygenase subunit alpha [Ramlibacter aurantiacus]